MANETQNPTVSLLDRLNKAVLLMIGGSMLAVGAVFVALWSFVYGAGRTLFFYIFTGIVFWLVAALSDWAPKEIWAVRNYLVILWVACEAGLFCKHIFDYLTEGKLPVGMETAAKPKDQS